MNTTSAPMMRSRQSGTSCPYHGTRCAPDEWRRHAVVRSQEKRRWRDDTQRGAW